MGIWGARGSRIRVVGWGLGFSGANFSSDPRAGITGSWKNCRHQFQDVSSVKLRFHGSGCSILKEYHHQLFRLVFLPKCQLQVSHVAVCLAHVSVVGKLVGKSCSNHSEALHSAHKAAWLYTCAQEQRIYLKKGFPNHSCTTASGYTT